MKRISKAVLPESLQGLASNNRKTVDLSTIIKTAENAIDKKNTILVIDRWLENHLRKADFFNWWGSVERSAPSKKAAERVEDFRNAVDALPFALKKIVLKEFLVVNGNFIEFDYEKIKNIF